MPRSRTEIVTLDSGKTIMRLYDDESGQLVNEDHSYGTAAIAITLLFQDGKKVGERYICKGRLVKRKRYEEARLSYPDMPPADSSIMDASADLLELEAQAKKEDASERRRHTTDPEKARQNDEFCLQMLNASRHAPAPTWLQIDQHSLGEMTTEHSRRFVDKLVRLGAAAIHVCQIKVQTDGTQNSGHLVVELPAVAGKRKSLLKELDRIAREQGYEGDPDDGQQYAYVKLD